MAIGSTVPILFVQQMGPAGRLASDIATHPEVAQNMSRHMTEAMLKQEANQVQKLDDFQGIKDIKEDGQHAGEDQGKREPKHKHLADEPPTHLDKTPSTEGPLLGNLINRKI